MKSELIFVKDHRNLTELRQNAVTEDSFMKIKLSAIVMVALLSLSVCININAQSLIQNGSFELPQVSFQEHFGGWNWQSLYGWGIGGSGDIAIHNGPANGGAYGPAQDGVNYLDLSGFGVSEMHAYIYQDFATIPGVVYSLVFYTASSSPTPTNTIRVSVFENVVGYLVNVTLTPLAQTGSLCWKKEVITFTAQMESTRLQFQDTSLVDDNASYIDNVSVTPFPVITRQPTASQSATVGSSVRLSVSVATNQFTQFGYQWFFGTNAIPGATNSVLVLTNVQSSQSGSYTVTVTGSNSSVTSDPAMLSVLPGLGIDMVPRISLAGEVGLTYKLDYVNVIGPTEAWNTLATISVTNNPQFFYDDSAVGQPARFYRVVGVP